jgi:dTDP-4-dehydrorhamnose 3,5-epimerase
MKVEGTTIPDVKLIQPRIFRDERGFFSETWNAAALADAGIAATFVQDNHALSRDKGTLRGLHFQLPPMAQDKLVRVVRGAILDVAVDIRRSSPTFGRHVAAVLTADNWTQIWVPKGFAHGYCTLEPDTEVIYKVTAPYAPALDRGIAFDDVDLAVSWPVTRITAILSDKDQKLPRLAEIGAAFE